MIRDLRQAKLRFKEHKVSKRPTIQNCYKINAFGLISSDRHRVGEQKQRMGQV